MKNTLNLNCPACLTKTRTISIKSHYDASITIEQCLKCGGIWFNNLDFHKVKLGEASIIEKLDTNKLQELSVIKNTNLACPKDNSPLIQFNDLNFPKEIIIEKCPKCNGFWFNRGEFLEYQNIRIKNQKLEESKGLSKSDFEDKIMRTLEMSGGSEKNIMLRDLAKFLSTPIDRSSLRPLHPEQNTENANLAINLALGTLNFIMRLFLR